MRCTALTRAEERTQMAIWSIISSPLLISTDVAKMPAASKADLLNTEVLAVSTDRLGRQGWRVRNEGADTGLQVWVRPLFDGSVAVALHNGNNASTSEAAAGGGRVVTASLLDAGLGGMTAATVRDLFAKTDLAPAVANGTVSVMVEPHGVVLLRLTPSCGAT